MFTRLGWYIFCAKCQCRGLTLSALARLVVYRNVRKGVRRILRFELHGHCPDTLLVNLAETLGIHYHVVLVDLMERGDLDASPLSMPFPPPRIASADLPDIAPTLRSS